MVYDFELLIRLHAENSNLITLWVVEYLCDNVT